jgi:hypothetical protein
MQSFADLWFSGDLANDDLDALINFDLVNEAYPIRNPQILRERQSAVAALHDKFPTLSSQVCEVTLEEHHWNPRLAEATAADLVSDFCKTSLTKPFDDDSHPSVQSLRKGYPDIPTALIVLAARQSAYDIDTASLLLDAAPLLDNLQRELAALTSANSRRDRFLAACTPRQSLTGATPRRKAVLTCDMHGLTRANYRDAVLDALDTLTPGIKKVNFITGRGLHSKNETPLLRPLVMKLVETLGYRCEVMPANPGIVQVFIPEPRETESGMAQAFIPDTRTPFRPRLDARRR